MFEFFPAREVVLEINGFTVRWYGLLWAISFWLVWYLIPKLQKYRNLSLSRDEWTRIIAYGAIGALLGGRLGYVLLYEPTYFFQYPLEAFAIWQGGMASHGGVVGVVIGVWFATRLNTTMKNLLQLTDVVVVPVALALALGRLGNWINQELFVRNFALLAVAKDLCIAGLCYYVLRKTDEKRRGIVTAIFLISYSLLRFCIEFLRDDPWPEVWGLTRGQVYTLPLLALGVWLLVWLQKQPQLSKKPTVG
ncbi:MAG: prolipoprotein diacylglyceryl transferase [Candidatus Andersenbacteria bacterium]|nr:prolipoprotein diacylglyceryl transferase [Candidatus Andersenbacteria bacterium]MBI3250943.1 prolipoprotein diacylglyceryl transferase [Candidatus Andersenbacteria bacterium]